jgi:mannosyl-oligosaccharide alpha-1,2-mannosidase
MFFNKPVLRNVVYAVAICLTLYILFFTIASRETYIPKYLKPRPDQQTQNWPEKSERVKAAFLHAYHSYEQYAAPHDELRPKTRVGSDQYVQMFSLMLWKN